MSPDRPLPESKRASLLVQLADCFRDPGVSESLARAQALLEGARASIPVADADALAQMFALIRERVNELEGVQQENAFLRDERKADQTFAGLIGESGAMQGVRRAILQVARTDSTVLVLGETGTGKELIAQAIHKISARRSHLLVKVNCAALVPGVVASELFGHEGGAFTGAGKRRLGRFEIAHGGTIFLDEVAEIAAEVQVLLLRVLQERVLERVGGNEPIAVNVRVIAATHRDLPELVRDGRFRADLFYRLNVFPLRVPPLRERREDIPALADHFLRHFARKMNRAPIRIGPRSMELLLDYSWPGNIRELENVLERALIVTADDEVRIDPTWLAAPRSPAANSEPDSLADIERRSILEALAACGGKVYGAAGAARKLGLKPSTLYGKMRKHGIERNRPSFGE